jgi:hypothetical protein
MRGMKPFVFLSILSLYMHRQQLNLDKFPECTLQVGPAGEVRHDRFRETYSGINSGRQNASSRYTTPGLLNLQD